MSSASVSTRPELWLTVQTKLATFSNATILLFAGSFLVHLVVALIFIRYPIALDDMYQYDMLARSIRDGRGYRWYSQDDLEVLWPYYEPMVEVERSAFPDEGLPTAHRAPGYPLFLALLYVFTPDAARFAVARVAQAGLAAALAPLAALMGRRAGFRPRVCLLAAIGVSLYPILMFYPVALASENLYILLGLASLITIYRLGGKYSPGGAVLAGLLAGLTMLTRSVFAPFVLLAGLWLARFSPGRKKTALVFLSIAFGLCLPWAVRNSLLAGKPAFVEGGAGYNLYIANHPQGDGGFISSIAIPPLNILNDADREQVCMQQAITFIRQDPLEAARRAVVRLVRFMGIEGREFYYFYTNNLLGPIGQPWLVGLILQLILPWGFTLILGAAGLWLTWSKERKLAWLVGMYLISYLLPHVAIIAEPRFHLAWVPVLMPFAVVGWSTQKFLPGQRLFARKNIGFTLLMVGVLALILSSLMNNLPVLSLILQPGGNELRFAY
ncbi:MAG: hypothetical protein JW987_05635 [Anaerolineaceae bacterium]|nr:hypothetical protein [Anaerolineaceae bacterium]